MAAPLSAARSATSAKLDVPTSAQERGASVCISTPRYAAFCRVVPLKWCIFMVASRTLGIFSARRPVQDLRHGRSPSRARARGRGSGGEAPRALGAAHRRAQREAPPRRIDLVCCDREVWVFFEVKLPRSAGTAGPPPPYRGGSAGGSSAWP